ncbi:MAG: GtrA family protein, partial [Clostridia bacterium]|nr:GtrA family protein [Clostridia bacterium]
FYLPFIKSCVKILLSTERTSVMKDFFKKHRELIIYIIVGGLTTVANYIIHFGLRFLGANYYISLSGAWLGAVFFAYVANRVFVFESKVKGKAQFKEFLLFISARLFSYAFELLIAFIFIDLAHADSIIWQPDFIDATIPIGELLVKTSAQVIIVLSNYIFSKLIIFKKDV